MRDRAVANEDATDEDIARMQDIVREAVEAGAIGFNTGRSDNHQAAAPHAGVGGGGQGPAASPRPSRVSTTASSRRSTTSTSCKETPASTRSSTCSRT